MRKIAFWILALGALSACDTSRIFEENIDLPNEYWVKDQPVTFEFTVEDASLAYNLYANVRNSQSYQFNNLYYKYQLTDSLAGMLSENLENLILFEPKTGEPLGRGLGDIFDQQQLILDHYKFPAKGKYIVNIEQYMRQDTLPLILSVGLRVEKAAP